MSLLADNNKNNMLNSTGTEILTDIYHNKKP